MLLLSSTFSFVIIISSFAVSVAVDRSSSSYSSYKSGISKPSGLEDELYLTSCKSLSPMSWHSHILTNSLSQDHDKLFILRLILDSSVLCLFLRKTVSQDDVRFFLIKFFSSQEDSTGPAHGDISLRRSKSFS